VISVLFAAANPPIGVTRIRSSSRMHSARRPSTSQERTPRFFPQCRLTDSTRPEGTTMLVTTPSKVRSA
jgi:hypothetical protein